MEILWKGTVYAKFRANHPKLSRNCAFPQNFHTRKLGEITVFFAVRGFHSVFLAWFGNLLQSKDLLLIKLLLLHYCRLILVTIRWDKVFKNRPSELTNWPSEWTKFQGVPCFSMYHFKWWKRLLSFFLWW